MRLPDELTVRYAEDFIVGAYESAGKPRRCADHSLLVGGLLAEEGCSPTLVVAGILHDVVEDTCVTEAEVRQRFGDEIGGLVAAVTEDPTIPAFAARKAALRASVRAGGPDVQRIYAADKVARLRAADDRDEAIEPDKLEHYRRSLGMLLAGGRRDGLVDELHERLRLRPPLPVA